MGKPYAKELSGLPKTFAFATGGNKHLSTCVASTATRPLVVVGSGGSLSAATYIAQLHEYYTGHVAKALTPHEFIEGSYGNDASVWCLTANGQNADIRAAFEIAAKREPKQLVALCMATGSQISKLGMEYGFSDVVEIAIPTRKDGFLATNSLIAMATFATAAYQNVFDDAERLPTTLSDLLRTTITGDWLKILEDAQDNNYFSRQTISLIYTAWLRAAGVDLESRFVEASLGNLHIADVRNFAHGRHLWLAKRGNDTSLLVFYSRSIKHIVDRTLRLLPGTSKLTFEFDGPFVNQALAGLTIAMHVAGASGRYQSIDPGRPGVPRFGKQIYHLHASTKKSRLFDAKAAAVSRKSTLSANSAELIKDLNNGYVETKTALVNSKFGGVVFDFDGTLCDQRHRFEDLRKDISNELVRLLRQKAKLAVVTGRGKSVRKSLQKAIPRIHWKNVLVGYYNGGEIAPLDNDAFPSVGDPPDSLSSVVNMLMADACLKSIQTDIRKHQVTVTPKNPADIELLWCRTKELVEESENPKIKIVRSSHSIDILSVGVSKTAILESFKNGFATDDPLLRIGDRGRWPGNDYQLLDSRYGLSVDEVSTSPLACWNFAPAGFKGVQATLFYLKRIEVKRGKIHIELP